MTRTLVSVSWRLIAASTLAVIGSAAGCGGRASAICSADPSPSASAVLIDVSLDANAGGTPFAIGAKMMSNDWRRIHREHAALLSVARRVARW